MNEENIKIRDIIDALKKRWQLIAGIVLVATILSAIVSFFVIKPKYQASTKLFIGKEDSNQQATYNNSDVQMYQQIIKTYINVINTKDLVGRALENKGINKSSSSVLSNLSVSQVGGNTQILEISYTSTDKEQSKDVIEAITEEFIKCSSELITNSNVKIVEQVRLPEKPVSPNKKLNIMVAFVLGFFIGVVIAIMLEFMDNTFKDKESLEKISDLPVIGAIPNWEKVK